MILVLTNSEDATADYFCGRLVQESADYVRFDTDTDLRKVSVGYGPDGPRLSLNGRQFEPADFGHVWYRRPHPLKSPVQSPRAESWQIAYEWSEAVEGFLAHIPIERWINHPSRNALASHKLEQLTRARHFGLSIPATLMTQSATELKAFWHACDRQVVVKPLACGFIERDRPEDDSHIYTNRLVESDLADTSRLANCPTLFQHLINKAVDVRVVVVDSLATAIAIHGADNAGKQRLDIRRNNMADVRYEPVSLPAQVCDTLMSMLRSYGLRFAAVDFAIDGNGEWVFFEINPNGQWAWLDLAGASNIADTLMQALLQECPNG